MPSIVFWKSSSILEWKVVVKKKVGELFSNWFPFTFPYQWYGRMIRYRQIARLSFIPSYMAKGDRWKGKRRNRIRCATSDTSIKSEGERKRKSLNWVLARDSPREQKITHHVSEDRIWKRADIFFQKNWRNENAHYWITVRESKKVRKTEYFR